MRVLAGRYKSKLIRTINDPLTRPMMSRVRESIFNSLQFNIENKDILGLSEAYKEIFASKNIYENISKLNGSFQENPLVKNVIDFITKDKKRSICTPFS